MTKVSEYGTEIQTLFGRRKEGMGAECVCVQTDAQPTPCNSYLCQLVSDSFQYRHTHLGDPFSVDSVVEFFLRQNTRLIYRR